MKINYEEQAKLYENTRSVDPLVYSVLSHLLSPVRGEKMVDFGCGTGNYLKQFLSDYGIDPYGIEPSLNMRRIAQQKIGANRILEGDHTHLPYSGPQFEKLYCVDVIHHIRQLDLFFQNLLQVSVPGGLLCICTESKKQLEEKYWIKYFPDIVKADLERFHPINSVVEIGRAAGWIHRETVSVEAESTAPITSNFMDRVRQKNLSAFYLISDEAYERGVSMMERDYQGKTPIHQYEGYTFTLFERGNENGL